jgi:hypothetical protein
MRAHFRICTDPATALHRPRHPLSLARKRADEYDVELSMLLDWLTHEEVCSRMHALRPYGIANAFFVQET